MLEFIHDIMESWILESASGGLGPLRRSLLQGHLKSCRRCRSYALDLIEFSHDLEPKKQSGRLSGQERDEIHASVMAAFHRELAEERSAAPFQRAQGPLVRLSFIKAVAMASLIVGAAILLSYPYRSANFSGGDGSAANLANPMPSLQAPEATPTLTPSPSNPPK
jgi:hypothetical protein